jgi:hypothetical protein
MAYQQAISLKVDSLALMGKATQPYVDHETEVETLMLRIEKAYEYARGRPNNQFMTQQWEILKDPERNLLGGFIKRWHDEGSLSVSFVIEAKRQISSAFDQIIGLESGLIKPDWAK